MLPITSSLSMGRSFPTVSSLYFGANGTAPKLGHTRPTNHAVRFSVPRTGFKPAPFLPPYVEVALPIKLPRHMAGMKGFEPLMWESKSHALTAWLHPHVFHVKSPPLFKSYYPFVTDLALSTICIEYPTQGYSLHNLHHRSCNRKYVPPRWYTLNYTFSCRITHWTLAALFMGTTL